VVVVPGNQGKASTAIILHTRVSVVCLCACARWTCICSLIGMQSLPLLSPSWPMHHFPYHPSTPPSSHHSKACHREVSLASAQSSVDA
jgi:hypothetical protein